MGLAEVKKILNTDDDRLDILYQKAERRLLLMLRAEIPIVSAVPEILQDIVDEVTISRYGRIGAEGMSTKSVEGRSVTYQDNDFAPFLNDIKHYVESEIGKISRSGKVLHY